MRKDNKNGVATLQIKLTTSAHKKATRIKEQYREQTRLETLSWPEFLDILLKSFEWHRRK